MAGEGLENGFLFTKKKENGFRLWPARTVSKNWPLSHFLNPKRDIVHRCNGLYRFMPSQNNQDTVFGRRLENMQKIMRSRV